MLHAITVDVEDYFHAANLEPVAGPARWHMLPARVEGATDKVLELFSRNNVHGTFFILGHSARRFPTMVRKIADAGHEIGSHGYGHRLAYTQTKKQFFRDVRRSKKLLEDLTGRAIHGYRAPNFSLTPKNPWAYDALIEAGYLYDSSRYPVWHPRYANVQASLVPEIVTREAGEIFVFPLAVHSMRLFGREIRLPLGGGAYWRLFPRRFVTWGLGAIERERGAWCTTYLHPWELDAEQPKFHDLSFLTKLRHYGGVFTFEEKLEKILQQFSFGRLRDAALQTFGSRMEAALTRADSASR